MFIPPQLFAWFAIVTCLAAGFALDSSDYNAYGLKVAANNVMIVQADNYNTRVYIQFGNYTDDMTTDNNLFYTIDYPDSLDYDDSDPSDDDDPDYSYYDYFDSSPFYIYSVAVGKSPSATLNIFFVGALIDSDSDSHAFTQGDNASFAGVLRITSSLTEIYSGNFSYKWSIKWIGYAQQEHLVLITNPLSTVAYGFSNNFTFSYVASTNNLTVHPNNSLSPSSPFLPFAADYDGNRGIIAGLLLSLNNKTRRVTYSATVILFSINASTANATQIGIWTYPSTSSTWQSGVTFTGAEQYNPEYDMSVSINPAATQVLVGIQEMNSVFLFSYTTDKLTFVTSLSRSQGIGFGKGVAWLRDTLNSVAILANVYSTGYVWSSSNIYIYDSPLTNVSIPVSIFPNSQQLLYSSMSPVFINIVTTPDHLVFIDDQGDFFIILSAPAGYYSSTTGPSDSYFFASSSQSQCIPGTYKNVSGVRLCRPCPSGTKNDGTNPAITTCVDCAANAFCPLGSITDSISNDEISNVTQVLAYPESPDITSLDDILFFTLFSIGSTGRCVALSPIFWTLVVAAIGTLIAVVMLIIKYCVKDPKIANSFKTFRTVFRRTDLIREGDMWSGGLATFCVLVLCISCCVFSVKYYNSYPIETAGPSTYTCDTTIRNAQFSTSVWPLSIPASDTMQDMIDLLDEQAVNLDVSFLNTIDNCTSSDSTVLEYLLGSTWLPISSTVTCNASNYIATYSAVLPFRLITVRLTLPNTNMIGGLRLSLNAPGKSESSTIMLQDLGFSRILSQSGRMLGYDAQVSLEVTKVINKTSPLVSGDDDVLSGIWTGLFTVNYYESFMSDSEYLNALAQTSTNLTLTITETPYYVLNKQDPIARLAEIIYHDFLFITMIIGMFVLIFIVVEIMILPGAKYLIRKCRSKNGDKDRKDDSRHSSAADGDPENPNAHSKKPDHSKKVLEVATVDNSAPLQERPFTSIQSVNLSDNDDHQMSPTRKREVHTFDSYSIQNTYEQNN